MRPEGLLRASAGGAARSAGAGRSEGRWADAIDAASSATAVVKNRRITSVINYRNPVVLAKFIVTTGRAEDKARTALRGQSSLHKIWRRSGVLPATIQEWRSRWTRARRQSRACGRVRFAVPRQLKRSDVAGQAPAAGWCFALAAVRSTRKFLTTRTTRSSLILPGLCRRGRTIRHPNQMPDASARLTDEPSHQGVVVMASPAMEPAA